MLKGLGSFAIGELGYDVVTHLLRNKPKCDSVLVMNYLTLLGFALIAAAIWGARVRLNG